MLLVDGALEHLKQGVLLQPLGCGGVVRYPGRSLSRLWRACSSGHLARAEYDERPEFAARDLE